jgi:hypothetical protein
MPLTNAQLVVLKANILADPILNAFPNDSDGNFEIARLYNLQAVPNWTVWKSLVTIAEIGFAIEGSELDGLTTANTNRLQVMQQYSPDGIMPSRADRRAFFDGIFSGAGGTITRPRLLLLYKRLATRAEKLFSTGTGSDALPATLVFEGNLSFNDVTAARNLP